MITFFVFFFRQLAIIFNVCIHRTIAYSHPAKHSAFIVILVGHSGLFCKTDPHKMGKNNEITISQVRKLKTNWTIWWKSINKFFQSSQQVYVYCKWKYDLTHLVDRCLKAKIAVLSHICFKIFLDLFQLSHLKELIFTSQNRPKKLVFRS